MAHPDIGRRAYGRRILREKWYNCAIMDEPTPESDTVIETDPTSKYFGYRVCLKHQDELGYNFNVLHTPIRTNDNEDF